MVSCTKESLLSQDDRFSVEEDVPQREIAMGRPPWRIPCLQLLWGCLALSMTINFLLMSPWSGSSAHLASYEEAPSPYASLTRSLAVVYVHQTKYWAPGNKTLRQELWDDIEIEPGFVALENESKHLPRAQGLPWDSNKSVYVLQAYHNLHCLKMLYTSITESHEGIKQSMSYLHLAHCLDAMRQDTICNADDTPMATKDEPDKTTGDGQVRKCRDFGKLDGWAKEHPGCYKLTHLNDPSWRRIDKFKYCPADLPYLPQIREHFGLGSDWSPEDG